MDVCVDLCVDLCVAVCVDVCMYVWMDGGEVHVDLCESVRRVSDCCVYLSFYLCDVYDDKVSIR